MKNIYSLFVIIAVVFASCSQTGNKADTSDKQAVEKNAEYTQKLTTISDSSYIQWRAAHLGGVQQRWGKVFLNSAEVLLDGKTITNAHVSVDLSSLEVNSFGDDTATATKLRDHLLSKDFFTVSSYPYAEFEMTAIAPHSGEYNSKVSGNLRIMDSTKNITFLANVFIADSLVSIVSEDFSVDRRKWGLNYNTEGTKGVPVDYLIDNDMGFTINVAVKK
ncbi:MAG: YceI family protein [Bacteroidota bacterium]